MHPTNGKQDLLGAEVLGAIGAWLLCCLVALVALDWVQPLGLKMSRIGVLRAFLTKLLITAGGFGFDLAPF